MVLANSYGMGRADFDAEIVSNTVPDVVTAGQNVEAVITVKNTGKKIWPGDGSIILSPGYDNTFSSDCFLTESISPGQEKTFGITITAPKSIGTYEVNWRMENNSNCLWFGKSLTKNITVVAPDIGTIELLAPSEVHVGDIFEVKTKVLNANDLQCIEEVFSFTSDKLAFVGYQNETETDNYFNGMFSTKSDGLNYIPMVYWQKQTDEYSPTGMSAEQMIIQTLKFKAIASGQSKVILNRQTELANSTRDIYCIGRDLEYNINVIEGTTNISVAGTAYGMNLQGILNMENISVTEGTYWTDTNNYYAYAPGQSGGAVSASLDTNGIVIQSVSTMGLPSIRDIQQAIDNKKSQLINTFYSKIGINPSEIKTKIKRCLV